MLMYLFCFNFRVSERGLTPCICTTLHCNVRQPSHMLFMATSVAPSCKRFLWQEASLWSYCGQIPTLVKCIPCLQSRYLAWFDQSCHLGSQEAPKVRTNLPSTITIVIIIRYYYIVPMVKVLYSNMKK